MQNPRKPIILNATGGWAWRNELTCKRGALEGLTEYYSRRAVSPSKDGCIDPRWSELYRQSQEKALFFFGLTEFLEINRDQRETITFPSDR